MYGRRGRGYNRRSRFTRRKGFKRSGPLAKAKRVAYRNSTKIASYSALVKSAKVGAEKIAALIEKMNKKV